MKKLFPILCLAALLVCAGSCTKKKSRIYPFGWERIDAPFDSLTERLEWDYFNGVDFDSIAEDVEALNVLAKADPGNNQKQVRAAYWDARYKMRTDRYDEAMELFNKAEQLALKDSSRYPYDLARIRWNLEPYYTALTVEDYDKILADIDFFEAQGDYPLAAAKCMDIGMLMSGVGAMDESMFWLDKADSLFAIAGLEDNIMKNAGNRAKNLQISGKKDEARRIFQEILDNPRIDRDPIARDVFLFDMYFFYNDMDALRRAYDWVKTVDSMSEVQCLYESCLAYEYAEKGEVDSALMYMSKAEEKVTDFYDPFFGKIYYDARAEVFNATGQYDSAFIYMKKASVVNDSVYNLSQQTQVLNADVLRQLGQHKLDLESRRHRSTVTYIIIIAAVIFIGGVITFLVYRKYRIRREAVMRSELELERSQRKVMAMQLAMEESGRIIDGMNMEMEKLVDDGKLSAAVAQKLETTIRAHESVRGEQDNFINTFGEVDPGFIRGLRERWPELTETDIKLCMYISLGLDSKHIARQMGIRPESVKQARWRLRKKLDPTGTRTIEEVLGIRQ